VTSEYIDLGKWRDQEARITSELRHIFAEPVLAPLWRATNVSVHVLYSACAQHGVAEPCSHTEDEHVLMGLGGRVLTNTLAAVRLLLAGYYGPSTAQVRDSIETTMLLGLFEAAPDELAAWRSLTDSKERWAAFSPGRVRNKLDRLNVWHRYDDYNLLTGLAGHPTPQVSRVSFSDARQRRIVGPFVDAEVAKKTLHAVTISVAHGAFQITDVLKGQERFATELEELRATLRAWSSSE
jgi:hypothetical protein